MCLAIRGWRFKPGWPRTLKCIRCTVLFRSCPWSRGGDRVSRETDVEPAVDG